MALVPGTGHTCPGPLPLGMSMFRVLSSEREMSPPRRVKRMRGTVGKVPLWLSAQCYQRSRLLTGEGQAPSPVSGPHRPSLGFKKSPISPAQGEDTGFGEKSRGGE